MKDEFNFDNPIFKYLQKYFIDTINEYKNIGNKVDESFGFVNNLYDKGVINDDELDVLLSNNNQLVDYVISIISSCPYLNINLHN